MKRLIFHIILSFMLYPVLLTATDPQIIDSLKCELDTLQGVEKVDLLCTLAHKYKDDSLEESLMYGRAAYNLADDISYIDGQMKSLSIMGLACKSNGLFEKSLTFYLQALSILELQGDREAIARGYTNIGTIYYQLGDFDLAINYLTRALNIRVDQGNSKEIADSHFNLGLIYQLNNDNRGALEHHLEALELRTAAGDSTSMSKSMLLVGNLYGELGQYEDALKILNRAFKLNISQENDEGIARSLNHIGDIFWKIGDYDKALEYNMQALSIYEELDQPYGRATMLNNIGNIYNELEKHDLALKFYLKSQEQNQQINDRKNLSISLNNIGGVYWKQGKLQKALTYYEESLHIKKELGDKPGIAAVLNNIGLINLSRGKSDSALIHFNEALTINREMENKKEIGEILKNIGRLYKANSDLNQAILFMTDALTTARDIGARKLEMECLEELTTIYTETGDYQTALERYKEYGTLKDSLFSNESEAQIAELTIRYETDKKQQLIELLQKQNAIDQLKNSRQRLTTYLIAGLLIAAAFIVIAIYNRIHIRQITQSNQKLIVARKELKNQQDHLEALVKERTADISRVNETLEAEIQERIKAEQALRESQNVLEDRVKARTAELEKANEQLASEMAERKQAYEDNKALEAQLIQSQKLESIGTLASGVAHEINNPLTGIINYADLIQSRIEDKELSVFADGIIEEGNRVAAIVKDLLGFARKDEEKRSPVRLEELINSTITLVGATLRKDRIQYEIEVEPDLHPVFCHSQQIQQVIMNLLTNAHYSLNQKFPSWHKNKVIRILVMARQNDGMDFQRITIEDRGIGVSSEIAGQIFDPFFTTKNRTEGTGLGLSVSYGIIKNHGGELSLESIDDKFTCFHIDLPCQPPES